MKKHLLLLLTAFAFVFFSCGDDKNESAVYDLEVDKTAVNFTADGTSEDSKLTITSNAKWQVEISAGATWLKADKTSGEGNGTVTLTADKNTTDAELTATVTIKSLDGQFASETVTVKLAGLGAEFNVFSVIKDEAFRMYCAQFDTDEDGQLSIVEAKKVKKISVSENSEIKSLAGIEYFTALEWLSCYSTNITVLDVSKNTALKYLNCAKNPNLSTIYVWEEFDTENLEETIQNIVYDIGVVFQVK